jgi:hypothetical protein
MLDSGVVGAERHNDPRIGFWQQAWQRLVAPAFRDLL